MRRFCSTALPLLVLIISTLLNTSFAACANGDVTCNVCPASSNVGNSITGLPRLNTRGELISADLGAYDWYTCDAFGNNCASFLSDPTIGHWANKMPDNHNPINYIQSVAFYVLFGFLCVLLSITLGCSICCFRYCFDRHIGGLCGGVYPQRRLRWVGVVIDPEKKVWKYSQCEKWTTRFLMTVFVALIFTYVGMGYFKGSSQLPANVKQSMASPSGFVNTIQSTQAPIAELVMTLASRTVPQIVANISNAFNSSTVSLPAIQQHLTCIVSSIQSLPNTQTLQTALASLFSNTSTSGVVNAIYTAETNTENLLMVATSTSATALLYVNSNQSQLVNNYLSLSTLMNLSSANISAIATGITALNTQYTTPLLNAMQSYETHYPNSTILVATSTSNYASLGRVTYNASTTPMPITAERNLLLARLTSINSSLAAMPNVTSMAAQMSGYDLSVNSLIAVNGPVGKALSSLQASLNILTVLIPSSLSTLNSSLNQLNVSVAALDFSPVTSYLDSLNSSLNTMLTQSVTASVNSGLIGSSLAAYNGLNQIVPCLAALSPLVDAVNAQLITLPVNSSQIDSYTVLVNSSLPAALAPLANITNLIQSSLSSLGGINFNVSTVDSSLDSHQLSLQSSLATVTNGSLIVSLNPDPSAALSNALTAFESSVLAAQYALGNSTITAVEISAFQALGAKLSATQALLIRMLSDLNTWTSDGQGIKRCSITTSSTCNVDADCASLLNNYCLTDDTRMRSLIYSLGNTSSSYISTSLLAAQLSVIQSFDLTPLNSANSALTASASNVSNDATSAINSFVPVANALSFVSNISTMISDDFAPLITALAGNNSYVNLTQINSSIQQINSSTVSIQSSIDSLNDVSSLVTVLYDFLYVGFPNSFQPQLLANNEAFTNGSGRLSTLTLGVVGVVQNITTYLNQASQLGSFDQFDFLSLTATPRQYMDVVYTNQYSQWGALYYFASVFSQIANSSFVTLVQPNTLTNQGLYNRDVAGVSYPSGTYCLSDSCLDNTVDYYTKSSLSTLTGGTAPVPLTAPQLNGLLYVIPVAIAVLGLLSMMMFFNYKASSYLGSLAVALSFIFLPLIFLAATILMPLLMVQSDVCYGGNNMVHNALLAKQNQVCAMLGGSGTAEDCNLNFNEFAIVLNIPALYADVIGGRCSSLSDDTQPDDAVLSMINSIRYTASNYPRNQMLSYIDSINSNSSSSSTIQIQPQLHDILVNAADSTVPFIDLFIDGIASNVSCANLNANWVQIQSSFCCQVNTSVFWFVGSWFMIALTTLILGIPVMMMGKKRFARTIPKDELLIIDRHFSKDRVLKDEAFVKSDDGPRKGGVAPVSARLYDEMAAIEMACSKAEAERAEKEEAEAAIRAVAAMQHKEHIVILPGEREQIDVLIVSPEASQQHQKIPQQQQQLLRPDADDEEEGEPDVDDQNDEDEQEGVPSRNASRRIDPTPRSHSITPQPSNGRVSQQFSAYSPNPQAARYLDLNPASGTHRSSRSTSQVSGGAVYQAVEQQHYAASSLGFEGEPARAQQPQMSYLSSAPTPMAVLNHPNASSAQPNNQVFSYGLNDSDDDDDEDDESIDDDEVGRYNYPALAPAQQTPRGSQMQQAYMPVQQPYNPAQNLDSNRASISLARQSIVADPQLNARQSVGSAGNNERVRRPSSLSVAQRPQSFGGGSAPVTPVQPQELGTPLVLQQPLTPLSGDAASLPMTHPMQAFGSMPPAYAQSYQPRSSAAPANQNARFATGGAAPSRPFQHASREGERSLDASEDSDADSGDDS